MRVVVSSYWSIAIKTLLGIDIFVALFVFFVLVNNYTYEGLLILGGFSLLCILATVWVFYIVRKLLTRVIITDRYFESFLINKRQCSVDRNKKIYYMVFRCAESVYSSQQFILISNSSFEYKTEERPFSGRIVTRYDLKAQILMPYDEKTLRQCDLHNWIEISNK